MMKKKPGLIFTLLQVFYWSSSAVLFPFAAFFFQTAGFGNIGTGIALGAVNIASLILSSIISSRIDENGGTNLIRFLVIITSIQAILHLVSFKSSGNSPVIAVLFSLQMCLLLICNPLYTYLFFTIQPSGSNISFGTARSIGSLAFAITSLSIGALIERRGFSLIFPVCLIFSVGQLAAVLLLSRYYSAKTPKNSPDYMIIPLWQLIKKNRELIMLFTGIALIFAANNTVSTYLINIVEYLGGSTTELGSLNAVIVLAETTAMFIYGIRRNGKVKNLLMLSLLFFPIKIVSIILASSTFQLYFAAVFHALAFGIYTPSMAEFIDHHSDRGVASRMQTLSINMQTLGSTLATLISGIFLDSLPVITVFSWLLVISAAGAAAGMLALRRIRYSCS